MIIFATLAFEIWLIIGACVLLLLDAWRSSGGERLLHWAFYLIILVGLGLLLNGWDKPPEILVNGFYRQDQFLSLLKIVMLLSVLAASLFSHGYLSLRKLDHGQYYVLATFSVMGMSVMISAANFLTLYLGLELMSLSIYAMIAQKKDDSLALESAMKYFILGAVASGLLLYGISMIYGATGQLSFYAISQAYFAEDFELVALMVLGLVFTLSGLLFKLGVAPFHMWLPDVYQGSPNAITVFIASAPKVAATALLINVLFFSLDLMYEFWMPIIVVVAVLSLLVGNLAAIAQTDIKRLLAYSAIAHSAFIVMSFLSDDIQAPAVTVYYLIAYVLMSVGGFGVVTIISTKFDGESSEIKELAGLAKRNWLLAVTIVILMLSLAGIPPVIGFYAKFVVLEGLVASGFVELAIFAVVLSLIAAFYYLRVVRVILIDPPASDNPIILSGIEKTQLIGLCLLVVLLGIFPNWLIALCNLVLQQG